MAEKARIAEQERQSRLVAIQQNHKRIIEGKRMKTNTKTQRQEESFRQIQIKRKQELEKQKLNNEKKPRDSYK